MTAAPSITLVDPQSDAGRALLGASHALMQSLYPAEANHYLSIEALCAPHIRFYVAKAGDAALGCVALANMGHYGEVKSLFVDPTLRAAGTGAALMAHLEAAARRENLPQLCLETGDTLYAAHQLYTRCGFALCGPFGDYTEGPHSVFMQKRLS